MGKPSPLNTLLYYSADDGMKRLLIKFESRQWVPQRDYSKPYDKDKKIIHFFPPSYDVEADFYDYDYQAESIPESFENFVEKEINELHRRYLSWFNVLFESQKPEKILSVIAHHQERINKLLEGTGEENTLPRRSLKIINRVHADYYQKLTTGKTLEQQREKITKTKIYERYWELRYGTSAMRRIEAYKEIYKWLIEDLQFTEAEIKESNNVNLSEEKFLRNADNQSEIKNRISAEYSAE